MAEGRSFLLTKTGFKLSDLALRVFYQDHSGMNRELEDLYTGEDHQLHWMGKDEASGPLVCSMKVDAFAEQGYMFRAFLKNEGSAPIFIENVSPLVFRGIHSTAQDLIFFRQGWQSWSASGAFSAREADKDPRLFHTRVSAIDLRNPSPGKKGSFTSDMYALLHHREKKEALLLGALRAGSHFTAVKFFCSNKREVVLEAQVDLDGLSLAPGSSMYLEPLVLLWGEEGGQTLLEWYADMVGVEMGRRLPPDPSPGWCSWYHYFTKVQEKDVVKNVTHLSSRKQDLPIEIIQVDDGYQSSIGDWLKANNKFPGGMENLASTIQRRGFLPGIWLAPFIALKDSRLFKEYPHWFLENHKKKPVLALRNPGWGWRNGAYALDTTNAEFQEYLRETIHTMVHQWGYRYLKLDFLYAAALPGKRFAADTTRAESLRQGLELIREAAGEDTFLLGCGCPLGPAIGVLDGMRIGTDVSPKWDTFLSRYLGHGRYLVSTRTAIRNILTRFYLHGRWWHNDPDCLLLRDRKGLNIEEIRSLATAIALCRGLVFVSDDLQQVSPQRQEILRQVLSIAEDVEKGQGRVQVLDLFTSRDPHLVLAQGKDYSYLAVFNFADKTMRMQVHVDKFLEKEFRATHMVDFWTKMAFDIHEGVLKIPQLPAHGVKLFRFRQT